MSIVAQSRLAELAATMFPPSQRAAIIADWSIAQAQAWLHPIVRDEDIARLEKDKRVFAPTRGALRNWAVLYSIGVVPDSRMGPCWVIVTALSRYKVSHPKLGIVWFGSAPTTVNIAYGDKLRDALTEMSKAWLDGRGEGDWLVRNEANRHYVGRRISAAERAIVPDLLLLASTGVKIWKDLP